MDRYALAGFEKVMLAAGAKATVTFPLEPEQLTVRFHFIIYKLNIQIFNVHLYIE